MNKHILLTVGIATLLLALAASTIFAADSDIVISEIMVNAKNDSSGEWVEIYNKGTTAVDLTGWQLEDNNATDTITADMCPNGSCSIPAGGYWLIAITQTDLQNEFDQYTNPNKPSVELNSTIFLGSGLIGNGLANDNDHLILRNSSGTAVDCSSWDGSGICAGLTYVSGGGGVDHNFDGNDGQSITNIQGSWYDHESNGSPYGINTASGGSPTAIILSNLRARSQAPRLPEYLGIGVAMAAAAGFFAYRRRMP